MEDFKTRMQVEIDELLTKIDRIMKFVDTEKFTELTNEHKQLLQEQFQLMCMYRLVLQRRIDLVKSEEVGNADKENKKVS